MTDFVRFRLPWYWEGLDAKELEERWRDLAEWVSWFVTRYHLAQEVPRCWHLHLGLVDELIALRHYHEEVTSPLVPLVQPDPVGDPPDAEDPATPARAYQDWHEARWRWTNGPLREASGYADCVAKGEHVDDEAHHDDAHAFAEASRIAIRRLFRDGQAEDGTPQ